MRTVTENTPNAKASEGKAFMVSHIFESVPNQGTVYIRHISGSTKYLHALVQILGTGKMQFTSYAGTTYTAEGTLLDEINRRSDSIETLEALFYYTPTIDVLGAPRLTFRFGGGTNPATARSSGATDDIESIFAPDTDVLVGVTNLSGSAQDITFLFNVHEE